MAALAATGVGAPAAAAVLGLIAGAAGAITSLHNISERSRRHTLEWDAEMALDVIGIIGVIPAARGAQMALAARAAGFSNVTRAGRFLQFYGWGEMGATVVLVPVKMADDIHRIETDTSLTDEQRKKLIAEVKLGALQTGLMMVGSATAARMGGHAPGRSGDFDESAPGLQRQIELLELEGFGQYKSLQERGLLDANGNWTAAAHMLGRRAAGDRGAPGSGQALSHCGRGRGTGGAAGTRREEAGARCGRGRGTGGAAGTRREEAGARCGRGRGTGGAAGTRREEAGSRRGRGRGPGGAAGTRREKPAPAVEEAAVPAGPPAPPVKKPAPAVGRGRGRGREAPRQLLRSRLPRPRSRPQRLSRKHPALSSSRPPMLAPWSSARPNWTRSR